MGAGRRGRGRDLRRGDRPVGELQPEAVLVDIGLPDGNGFTLAQQIAASPWRPRVIVISSDSDNATDAAASAWAPSDSCPRTSSPARPCAV